MADYTQFVLGVELEADTPEHVLQVLRYMINPHQDTDPRPPLPEHTFFSMRNWDMLNGRTCCTDGGVSCRLIQYDDDDDWHLSIRCSVPYGVLQIEAFLDWLSAHVRRCPVRHFCGHYLNEEQNWPTLIFSAHEREQPQFIRVWLPDHELDDLKPETMLR